MFDQEIAIAVHKYATDLHSAKTGLIQRLAELAESAQASLCKMPYGPEPLRVGSERLDLLD